MKLKNALMLATLLAIPGSGASAAASSEQPAFSSVLTAPDDVALNVQFARSEARAGRLLSAAAALERVLLSHDNLVDVRLFYIAVLCRLDDIQGAAAQLKLLDASVLTTVQKSEAGHYRRLVSARGPAGRPAPRAGGFLSAGIDFDSNALNMLVNRFDAVTSFPARSGSGNALGGEVHLVVPVDDAGTLALFGTASGYNHAKLTHNGYHFSQIEGQIGAEYTARDHILRTGVVGRRYEAFGARYLDEVGGFASARWIQTPATTWTASLEGVDQSFNEPSLSQLAQFHIISGVRDGSRYVASVDVSHFLSGWSAIGAGVSYEIKSASYKPFAYSALGVGAHWEATLDKGVYVNLNSRIRQFEFDQTDAFFTGVKRKTTRADARLAIGAPLSAFSSEGRTGDFRDDVSLEAAVRYNSRDEKPPLADFDDWGGDLKLVWRFGNRN